MNTAGGQRVRSTIHLAGALFDAGDYHKRFQLFEELETEIAFVPADEQAFYRSWFYVEKADFIVETLFPHLLSPFAQPKAKNRNCNISQSAAAHYNVNDAIRLYEEALKLDPHRVEGTQGLGILMLQLQRYHESEKL